MSVEIKLSRPNRIYHPAESLRGKIIVESSSSISRYGIRLTLDGAVNRQVRGGSAGAIEASYGAVKPIRIMNESVEIRPSGKIGSGTIDVIPFSLPLRHQGDDTFYETFRGENISIWYLVTVMRGYLYKSLFATMEFIIESDKANLLEPPVPPEMVIFYITQDTQRHPLLPQQRSGCFYASTRGIFASM